VFPDLPVGERRDVGRAVDPGGWRSTSSAVWSCGRRAPAPPPPRVLRCGRRRSAPCRLRWSTSEENWCNSWRIDAFQRVHTFGFTAERSA
jgi:hypothetical protein